jgi:hypothetical protein
VAGRCANIRPRPWKESDEVTRMSKLLREDKDQSNEQHLLKTGDDQGVRRKLKRT